MLVQRFVIIEKKNMYIFLDIHSLELLCTYIKNFEIVS